MDVLNTNIDKAAVRLFVSSMFFIGIQMGLVDPVIADQYREHVVDLVSAILLIIFALEFVIHSGMKLWHRLRNNTIVIEKPNPYWDMVNKYLVRFLTKQPVQKEFTASSAVVEEVKQ
jgi:hypothetical protein